MRPFDHAWTLLKNESVCRNCQSSTPAEQLSSKGMCAECEHEMSGNAEGYLEY